MKISVYNINDLNDEEYTKWYALLSNDKKDRIDKLRFANDRKRSVVGEMLVKSYISKISNIPIKDITLKTDKNGKPYTENANIYFNISHSGDMVVAAFHNKPIGIDIEKIKPIDLKIAKKVFNDDELHFLFHSSPPYLFEKSDDSDILKRFYMLWTAKEAYLKYTGTGIATELKNVSVNKKNIFNQFYESYVISVYSE